MEELIKLQLTNLYQQRGALVNKLTHLEETSSQYFAAAGELDKAVSKIDLEINNAISGAAAFLAK